MSNQKNKKKPTRAVDSAMTQERAEKLVMRGLWLECALDLADKYGLSDEPFYLTLSGADGKEIELLIKQGIIELTETGAIAEKSKNLVVAIENNQDAQIQLITKFPGLRVIREPVLNMLHGTKMTRFPDGARERDCRARIVNLDLNEAWAPELKDGEIVFPLMNAIAKLAQLHADAPRKEWVLFLTVHGQIQWPENVAKNAVEFLAENFEQVPTFAAACLAHLGSQLHESISLKESVDFGELPLVQQQKLLMAYVPKRISKLSREQGWKITTLRNIFYGDHPRHAPMVSWIFKFSSDPRAHGNSHALYKDCVSGILNNTARILPDGRLV